MKFDEFCNEDVLNYKHWINNHKCLLNTSNNKVDLEILRQQFEQLSLVYGYKYVLIDHLDYIYVNGKKKTALENIDDAVREIHALAMEYKLAVVLVVHPKQLSRGVEVTSNDLKGSSAIKQYADNIIIVTRMDRIDPNDLLRVKVRVWKNRLMGIESFFYLRYVSAIDGYTETF